MDREIPAQQAAWLRSMLFLEDKADLPPKLIEAYWELCVIGDRVSMAASISELKILCYLEGYGKNVRPKTLPPELEGLKPYTPVHVKWRDEIRDAMFLQLNANGGVAIEFPDGTRYTVAADTVSLIQEKKETPAKGKKAAKGSDSDIIELWKKKKLAHNDILLTEDGQEVKILSVNPKTKAVQVQLSDGTESEFAPDQLRVPELAGV